MIKNFAQKYNFIWHLLTFVETFYEITFQQPLPLDLQGDKPRKYRTTKR